MTDKTKQTNNPTEKTATEAVVLDLTQAVAPGYEAVAKTDSKNGAAGNQTAVQQPPHMIIKPGSLDPAGLPFYASVVKESNPNLAAAILAQKTDATLTGNFKRAMSHRVTIGDILVVGGVVVAVTFLWEGAAYKFDWPRFGLFDPSPKALPKK